MEKEVITQQSSAASLCRQFARYLHLLLYGKQMHTNKDGDWLLFHLCVLSVYISAFAVYTACAKSCTVTNIILHRHWGELSRGNLVKKLIYQKVCFPSSQLSFWYLDMQYFFTLIWLFATAQLFYFAPTVRYEGCAALEQRDSVSLLEVFQNCAVSFSHIGCNRFTSNTLTCS